MSLLRKSIKGVKWTTFSAIVMAIAEIVKLSVLTRLLDRTDFGLIAMVMFVLNFLTLFIDMGISSAILHKQRITKWEYASLYWASLLFSFILYIFLLVSTPYLSRFYNEPELNHLVPLLGVIILFSGIGRQFKTIEQKRLNFKKIALVDTGSALTALLIGISCAIYGLGVYSLVFSALVQHGIANIIFFLTGIAGRKLIFRFHPREIKPFLLIGIFRVGGQIANYFNRDIDILIVGKILGSEILGGYSLAKQIVFRPAQLLNPVLTKVASPVLARFQGNIQELRQNYLRLLNIVATINIPVYLCIAVFADPLVNILYTGQYDNIILVVRVLAIMMIIRAIGNPIGSLVIATGRTDLEFYWNLFLLMIMPIVVWIGALYSVEGVAIAILIARILLFVPSWYFLIWRMIRVGIGDYCRNLIPSFGDLKKQITLGKSQYE